MNGNYRRWFMIGTVLLLVAVLAPFFGLLGTIIGMIHSFGDMGRAGTVPASGELAEGISFSFSSTYIGLTVCAVAAAIGLGFTAAGWIGLFHEKTERQKAADASTNCASLTRPASAADSHQTDADSGL